MSDINAHNRRREKVLDEFVRISISMTDKEFLAFIGANSMDYDTFCQLNDKLVSVGANYFFGRLHEEHPNFSEQYLQEIMEDIKDVSLPERMEKEKRKSWEKLCKKIKKTCRDDVL